MAGGPRAPAGIQSSSAASQPIPSRDGQLLQRLAADWDRLCQQAVSQDAALGAALTACRPSGIADGALQLAHLSGDQLPAALAPGGDGLRIAERLLRQLLGTELRVQPLLAGGSGPSALAGGDTRNQAYRDAQQHPVIRELQQRFQAEILAREPSPRQRFLSELRGDAERDDG